MSPSPRVLSSRRRAGLLASGLAGLVAGALACSPSAVAPDRATLPLALAVRSDTPYVSGTITDRTVEASGTVRVRVRAPAGAGVAEARVPEADVRVHADSVLVWRDGRPARPADLGVGRVVVVWVRGPELRSMPPQVTGSAILVER